MSEYRTICLPYLKHIIPLLLEYHYINDIPTLWTFLFEI